MRSAWETAARNSSVSFCDSPLIFWAPSVRTIFCTLIFLSQLHEWIVVLDTSGIMWCNSLIAFAPRIWRDFGSALPFQTRLTQTNPVLPLSNEHGSQVKDQGRWQCCHDKHKNFPIGLHVMYLYFPDTPHIYIPTYIHTYILLNLKELKNARRISSTCQEVISTIERHPYVGIHWK